jgi:hypothetical protein
VTTTTGRGARRFDGGMLVDNEILTDFVEHTYLDPTDDRILDEILDREVAPGVSLRAGRAEMPVPGDPVAGPDRRWQGTMDDAVETSA